MSAELFISCCDAVWGFLLINVSSYPLCTLLNNYSQLSIMTHSDLQDLKPDTYEDPTWTWPQVLGL